MVPAEAMSVDSPIANWYRDQTLFITGSTGFMGKVLVEKLLRECPDIKACFLLMRTKRGIEPEQRHDDYVNHMVSCRDESVQSARQFAVLSGISIKLRLD